MFRAATWAVTNGVVSRHIYKDPTSVRTRSLLTKLYKYPKASMVEVS